ncbi:MAG: hypothetical protein ACD_80C00113G0008 [uncultured bacterium (gcode 4)]|uniref:Uncharacterized protein n=1 Tax=uncultured bacterium (gcode 4) TaxID=1234023 RepID=K1X4U7_9BACT|nr:MAG: hypothetical protein ACD_80C00113G0008 [uncultured bacterium (gcode 4)]
MFGTKKTLSSFDRSINSQARQKKSWDYSRKLEIYNTVIAIIKQFVLVHRIALQKNQYEYTIIYRGIDLLTSTEIDEYLRTGDLTLRFKNLHLHRNGAVFSIDKISLKECKKANITFHANKKRPQEEMY